MTRPVCPAKPGGTRERNRAPGTALGPLPGPGLKLLSSRLPSKRRQTHLTTQRALIPPPPQSLIPRPALPVPVPLALAEVLPPLTGQESHGSAPQLPPPTEPVQNPCPPRPRSSRRSPLISLRWDCRGGRAQQSWTGVQTRGSGAGRRRVSSSRDPEQPSLRCRILFACGGGRN